MIREVRFLQPLLCGVGAQQHDVQFLDSIAAELLFRGFDVRNRNFVAGPFERQVEHHAIAVTVLNGNSLGSRRRGIDVPPRIDMSADVVAGDDHAVVRNLVTPY